MEAETPKTFEEWVADIEARYCPIEGWMSGRKGYPLDARVHYALARLERLEHSGLDPASLFRDWKAESARIRDIEVGNSARRLVGIRDRYKEVFPFRHATAARAFGRDDFFIVPLRLNRKNPGAPDADAFRQCVYALGEGSQVLYVGNSKWSPHNRIKQHVIGHSRIGDRLRREAHRLEYFWCAWIGDMPDSASRHELEGEVIRRARPTYNENSPRNRRA